MNERLPCDIHSSNVLQGAEFDELVKKFFAKSRLYRQLDLNKILLSDVISRFPFFLIKTENKIFEVRYFRKINALTKELFSTGNSLIKGALNSIFYFWHLHMIQEGNNNIWYVTAENIRPSYTSEMGVKTTTNSLLTPSLITWKRSIYKKGLLARIKRLLEFLYLLKLCRSSAYTWSKTVANARLAMNAVDLKNDFLRYTLPKAVFAMKDFQRFENALIQIANLNRIPTFTTQHSVHHCFTGKNTRIGNIIFMNGVAKNVLCWGTAVQKSYKKYFPGRNYITSTANLRPNMNEQKDEYKKTESEKVNVFLLALGGLRHECENFKLLVLGKQLDEELKDALFIIRLHPTIDKNKYQNVLNNLKFNNKLRLQHRHKDYSWNYPKKTIGITGLTGAYYELLYLGYKVIYYDHGYELYNPLPRVLKPVVDYYDLKQQVLKCKNLSSFTWNKYAEPILKQTLNLSVREAPSRGVIDEIQKTLSLKDSSFP